jgi:lantibiotic modifying enzyme
MVMSPPAASSETFLAAAAGIGRALCREAYWDHQGNLCNWMGRVTGNPAEPGGPISSVACAIGPELYGGSTGVALFLAQLAAVTGDEDCRRTALGAFARSLRQLDRRQAADLPSRSFHGGPVGLAYAARRIAALTGERAMDARVDDLLARAADGKGAPAAPDVIGGHAGAIPALLALGGPRATALAVSLGEELCRTARRQGSIWVWEVEKKGGGVETPLTGLAHGAAGFALALLELHAATGRGEFLEGGRAAFAYEDQQFDPRVGNWPDLRALEALAEPLYQVAWCHGAPGIGLARLRAASLDAEFRDAHTAAARVALKTTQAGAEKAAQVARADACLCHGLAGLAEIVLTAGQWLEDDACRSWARALAADLIARHAAAGDWPCGVYPPGHNPSLMLGTAGIGYHFLRQYDPQRVPPILVVH